MTEPIITKETLRAFSKTLEEYRAGKRALEARILEAEDFWKLRHWRSIRPANPGEPEPASGWLVNTILSKHSDAVDAYPEPVCLAREEADKAEAENLSAILPVVLEQNDFDQVWSDVWWYKLKSGTGVYGVFWDPEKLSGLGDISIEKVDILNLFWEPGVRDIQKSKYLFHVTLEDNAELEARYPFLRGHLASGAPLVRQYRYDEAISTENKSPVVDVYYKKKGLLHYVKYVGQELLYATEEDPRLRDRGLYDHGKYPFVFDPLFPEEGYPGCGYGYVDLCKDPQKTVDILNNCLLQSAVAAATPRWFVRADGGVNEAEYSDLTKKFVHVTGRLGEDSVKRIESAPLPESCLSYMQMKVSEIKEVSGNRDVNNGSSSRVTAAAAITALQEAGNSLSRDMIASGYRAFRHVVELSIELMRQFYDLPRQFRILGPMGAEKFLSYSNRALLPRGLRLPVFDIQVEVQTQAEYKKQTYNDLAVRLYQMGAFDPARAQQTLTMLSMMDFKGKNELIARIAQGGAQMKAQEAVQAAMAELGSREHPFVRRARENAQGGV